MISIEHENTFKEVLKNGVNLFIGAGFSLLAKDCDGKVMPIGNQLADELIQEFSLDRLKELSLSQICTILESTKKEALYSFLKKRFSVDNFSDKYYAISKLNLSSIFTTNIDNLIYRIFESSKDNYINDITQHGPVYNDKASIDYIALHGSIIHEDNPLVFSTYDVASSFSLDPDKWHFLTERIQKTPTVFWGYGLADAGVLQALNPGTIKGREHKPKWIVLRDSDEAQIEYFRALDFFIIIANTEQLLAYVEDLKLFIKPSTKNSKQSTRDLFPEEVLPELGTVPVRPLLDFYMGAEPTWHDIYSGQLYKTSHFSNIIDSINSGKNTIIIGVPACGKTTLLMQASSDISTSAHKLICQYLTVEKSSLILRKLNGEHALIFVDNIADNIDALSILADAPNVQIVGSEREYNFDIVSHRIDRKKCNILDVTELNDKDLQEIFDRIPSEVRIHNFVQPKTELGILPSLYEVVETNIIKPSLRKRFNDVLKQLAVENISLHDLFVMCCYVHSCRTPVSFDMTYAFLRDEVSEFNQVYEMFKQLGALVSEYIGNLVDSSQDHFIPRSSIVSESVIQEVSSDGLRKVLLKYHREVSPLRICSYDVFRRRAFDASIAKKAFPEWKEGMKFYESMYERDRSPFLLQQGALYLSAKHRFDEAFSWIDRAVLQTNNRVPSIRNSHAIILFRANIQKGSEDETVKGTLKESMKILSECYRYDKRKTYHALVFTDHALQYWNVYGDSDGLKYLKTASEWLTSERNLWPWNRNVKRLQKRVLDKLRQL